MKQIGGATQEKMRKADKKSEKANQSQRILTTAFQCISARGYANVSMRDIADEAGVALSQLNYHYKSKEGLFTEVVKLMIQRYLHEIGDKLKSVTDAKDKISSLVKYFNELSRKNPELLKMFLDFTAQSLWLPSIREHLRKLFDDLLDMIEGFISDGFSDSKAFREYSSRPLAKLLIGTLYGTSIQMVLDPDREGDTEPIALLGTILEG